MHRSPESTERAHACPACRTPLAAARVPEGWFWHCRTCAGRLVSLAVLRKTVLRTAVNEVWQQVVRGEGSAGRWCPECESAMQEVHSTAAGTRMDVDICRRCTLIWFDAHEYETLPERSDDPVPPALTELPEEAREALAVAEVQAIAHRYREPPAISRPGSLLWNRPAPAWQLVLTLFGLPVETEAPERRNVPWMTWSLVAALLVVGAVILLTEADHLFYSHGFIPAQAFRDGGLTLFTAFFLHAGPLHLLSNSYFLLILGDNVEDRLGIGRFGLLLALATLAGHAAHMALDPRGDVPCVGASGGISGVLAYYALTWPQARFLLFIRVWWVTLSAWSLAVIWLALQVLGVWWQVQGVSSVSALAHLGGAAAGVLCWLAWRPLPWVDGDA